MEEQIAAMPIDESPEAEPKPDPPKIKVRGLIVLALFPLFFGAMTVIMYFVWQDAIQLENAYDLKAVTVEGTVVEKDTVRRRSGSGSPTTVHRVRYYFDSIVGQGVDLFYDRQEVSRGFYDSVTEGGTVMVQFLPGDPANNRVEDQDEDRTMMFVTIGMGVFAVLTLGLLGMSIRGWRKQQAEARSPEDMLSPEYLGPEAY